MKLKKLNSEHGRRAVFYRDYIKSLAHNRYSKTEWWKKRSKIKLLKSGRCECCLECVVINCSHGQERPIFDVHHLTYERVGEELDSDLAVVCSPCHNLIHKPNSPAAKHWLSIRSKREAAKLLAKAKQMIPAVSFDGTEYDFLKVGQYWVNTGSVGSIGPGSIPWVNTPKLRLGEGRIDPGDMTLLPWLGSDPLEDAKSISVRTGPPIPHTVSPIGHKESFMDCATVGSATVP